jgi:AcrR family transcriptional regulator
MNDVARQAGVSRMSVYRHFADRDTLVLAVLERIADDRRRRHPAVRRRTLRRIQWSAPALGGGVDASSALGDARSSERP